MMLCILTRIKPICHSILFLGCVMLLLNMVACATTSVEKEPSHEIESILSNLSQHSSDQDLSIKSSALSETKEKHSTLT